jgi:hypothetical protein
MHNYIIYVRYALSLNKICLAVLKINSGQIASTDKWADGQGDSSITPPTPPPPHFVCRWYNKITVICYRMIDLPWDGHNHLNPILASPVVNEWSSHSSIPKFPVESQYSTLKYMELTQLKTTKECSYINCKFLTWIHFKYLKQISPLK